MKARKIPSTDSIDELARFWDSHDLTDFTNQLEEITNPLFTRRSSTEVTVRLRPAEAKAVQRVAKTKHVREATEQILVFQHTMMIFFDDFQKTRAEVVALGEVVDSVLVHHL